MQSSGPWFRDWTLTNLNPKIQKPRDFDLRPYGPLRGRYAPFSALDRVEDDAGGEQLGEKERLGFAGLPEHIKRNGAALIRSFGLSRSSWPWVRDEDRQCAQHRNQHHHGFDAPPRRGRLVLGVVKAFLSR